MEYLTEKLLHMDLGELLGQYQESTRKANDSYEACHAAAQESARAYEALSLSAEQRSVIDRYIAALTDAEDRYAEASYLEGMEDAIRFLKWLTGRKRQRRARMKEQFSVLKRA